MTQIKHTPTPLHIEKDDDVHTFYFHIMQGDRMIARVSVASFEGDPQELVLARIWAEKIVHACNAHEELVAALEDILGCEKNRRKDLETLSMKPGSIYDFSDKRVKRAEAALAKAKAGAA